MMTIIYNPPPPPPHPPHPPHYHYHYHNGYDDDEEDDSHYYKDNFDYVWSYVSNVSTGRIFLTCRTETFTQQRIINHTLTLQYTSAIII